MDRLRIAVFHNLRSGGALRALDELVSRSRHEFHLYESADAAASRRAGRIGTGLDDACTAHFEYALPPERPARVPLSYASAVRRLDQLRRLDRAVAADIDGRGYDVAFVHPCGFRQTPGILRDLAGPTVYFMQEPRRSSFEPHYRDLRRPRRRSWLLDRALWDATEWVLARADRRAATTPGVTILCNSRYSAGRIRAAYGVRGEVSYLGVDPTTFAPGPPRVAASPYVVSVGRMDAIKGHGRVIDALASMEAARRPALHVVSDGDPDHPYAHELRAAAESSGVDLTIVTAVSDAALVAEYQSALATVCAAEGEPFGLITLESIACGTPVVAVRDGGFPEVVADGVNGVLVEPNAPSIARGIQLLAARPAPYSPEPLHTWVVDHGWTWAEAAARVDNTFDRVADAAG
ncbi:MAG: glycosyltransferase family 4 protein [Actinobacteria bacterium]|nr:glycosyltransferase family 4 protein [Actinomycetota bacterium]